MSINLKKLPELPGVYIFKDKYKNIIYIGKSKCLKKRIKQYFYKSKNDSRKIENLKFNIYDLDYIVTDTELEALILESKMIKKHKPKYNSLLKDFKSYPYIKITNEEFPTIKTCYKIKDDNALYFGPYNRKNLVYGVVEYINELFPIRKCGNNKKSKPCLYYHLGKCLCPYSREIDVKAEYEHMINKIINILNGDGKYLLKDLEEKMNYYSKNLNFEKAANYRDKLSKFRNLIYNQKIISKALSQREIIIIERDIKTNKKIYFVRGGRILGTFNISSMNEHVYGDIREFLYTLINKQKSYQQILLQEQIDEAQIIETWVNNNDVKYIDIEESMDINTLTNKIYTVLSILDKEKNVV